MFIGGLTYCAYCCGVSLRAVFVRRSKSKFYPQSGLNFKTSRPKKHIQKENPRFAESF